MSVTFVDPTTLQEADLESLYAIYINRDGVLQQVSLPMTREQAHGLLKVLDDLFGSEKHPCLVARYTTTEWHSDLLRILLQLPSVLYQAADLWSPDCLTQRLRIARGNAELLQLGSAAARALRDFHVADTAHTVLWNRAAWLEADAKAKLDAAGEAFARGNDAEANLYRDLGRSSSQKAAELRRQQKADFQRLERTYPGGYARFVAALAGLPFEPLPQPSESQDALVDS